MVINVELLIDLVEVGILALDEQVDLLLCQHHLQQIGFQATGVVEEIDILILCGAKTDKAHIELAHAGNVVEQLQLRRELCDVVAGAGTDGQQLHPTVAETG